MDWKKFCDESYKFLLSIKPNSLSENDLDKYFLWDSIKLNSLKDVFCRLIISAQNYQMLPNVINYYGREKEIHKILLWLDYKKIISFYSEESLYKAFQENFNIKIQNSKRNLRLKWSKSIISSAKFIDQFESIDDFKNFVDRFKYNEVTRAALPMLLSHEISWFWFALSCDFIKELWYTEYCKPDIHMIDVFSELRWCERNDYQIFKNIVKTANEWWITPYKLDKIIWLICSGNFYFESIKIWNHKKDFIEYMKQKN
jgi:hypothetical protein